MQADSISISYCDYGVNTYIHQNNYQPLIDNPNLTDLIGKKNKTVELSECNRLALKNSQIFFSRLKGTRAKYVISEL